jgi:hypothetical protein
MPVDSHHPQYDETINAVTLVRDCAFYGSRVVKARGERYLPRLFQQDDSEYTAYVQRATFFNGTKRTLHAFSGFVFWNNPDFETPDTMAEFMKDCTMTGVSFFDYCKKVVKQVFSVGRTGTLVDWDSPANEDRPFLVNYNTEDIVNWRYARVNGKTMLALLVLKEQAPEEITSSATADDYKAKKRTQYREIRLVQDAPGGQPYVSVTVYQSRAAAEAPGAPKSQRKPNLTGGGSAFDVVDQKVPMRGLENLQEIPFIFHNTDGEDADLVNIPLEDVAAVNIGHYMNNADLEQGRHVCGCPTLVLIGFPMKGDYVLGASKAIVTETPTAKADFLQMSSSALESLENGLAEKERQMAALGAQMLTRQGSGAGGQEAFQTVQIRQSGQVSALTDMTIACSQTLSRVLQRTAWWLDRSVEDPRDIAEDVFVELNTDFTTQILDPAMLAALMQAYITGTISYEVYFDALQRGGMISSERTIEDEIAALANRPVALPGGTGGPQPPTRPQPKGAGPKPPAPKGSGPKPPTPPPKPPKTDQQTGEGG